MRPVSLLVLICVLSVPSVASAAQDQDFFGSAVAFQDRHLLVVKRAPARGPAAVHVYRFERGGWVREGELRGPDAVERGLALSPSIAVGPAGVLVGAGDPYGRFGAHAWRLGTGQWDPAGDLTVGDAPAGAPTVSLATVMQVLSPAPRAVATAGDLALVGLQRGAHLFRQRGDQWAAVPITALGPAGYGAAVALGDGWAAVGAPLGGAGRVEALAPDRDGVWVVTDTLVPDSLADRARFGAAMAGDGATLVVGAPGAATTVIYERTGRRWVARQRLHPPEAEGFGTAVALTGNDLLVGAPNAQRVYHYRRGAQGWALRQVLDAPDAVRNGGFGLAVAFGPLGAAVGAPFAVGGRGRVVAYTNASDSLTVLDVLAPAGTPDAITGAEVRCADSSAAGFQCHDVDLQSFLSIEALGGRPGERVSDLWGWTDPVTGQEYALVGRTTALVFVDVTNPSEPVVVGEMRANPSGARDVKVYRDHAFLTGDGAGQHGLMVFDLTRLRGLMGGPHVLPPDTVYRGIASAHNLALDTATGLAVPVAASGGGETCGGGLHLVDIRNPKAPVFAGCYTDSEGLIAPGRTHDAQCVVYHGPDAEHQGRNICFASNETALRIVDVTDRANPEPLSAGRYPGAAYIHQGWLTEDHRYFYLDDELDELVGTTDRTRTMIWDVTDLDDPVMVGTYYGPDGATDHNLFIKGNRMYQANYQAGMRVVDISDPTQPREIGFFDTTPYDGNPAGFYGAWTAYPFFASGSVIVSSMQEGLFVLRPRQERLVP